MKEVKKPSVVPVQAPKFVATSWDLEVPELLETIVMTPLVQKELELITRRLSKRMS